MSTEHLALVSQKSTQQYICKGNIVFHAKMLLPRLYCEFTVNRAAYVDNGTTYALNNL
jgi:hypothetical protein